jgi:flagellar biosynthesis protein FlhG
VTRIIAIASGKGGVGKTWLAISLGQALARRGQRVLLFDGDLGLANVDVQLGLGPGPDLAAVLCGRCTLAEAVRASAPVGFDVLPGRSGCGQLGEVDAALLERLLGDLAALARGYDVTLLDLPAGIDRAVRRLLLMATSRLVVTTDEPTALTDAYALIKVSRRDGAASPLELVVNLAESDAAGRRTHDGLRRVCEHFLELSPPLAGVLRRDPRVVDAIRHQAPLLLRHPNSPAACDVEALARHLQERP